MKKGLVLFAIAFSGGAFAFLLTQFITSKTGANSTFFSSETPVFSANYSELPPGTTDFVAAAERSVNSVVHVKTEIRTAPAYDPWADFFGYRQNPGTQMASGSGVIISTDGYIVTNNHVVDGAEKIQVTLNNNKTYEAALVGKDPSTDIAVLKIDESNLPAAQWGNSDLVRVGQWVLAVGNPF
ncbi:MAG: S1C family serine protease, partial [Bacteroidota bacterium]